MINKKSIEYNEGLKDGAIMAFKIIIKDSKSQIKTVGDVIKIFKKQKLKICKGCNCKISDDESNETNVYCLDCADSGQFKDAY